MTDCREKNRGCPLLKQIWHGVQISYWSDWLAELFGDPVEVEVFKPVSGGATHASLTCERCLKTALDVPFHEYLSARESVGKPVSIGDGIRSCLYYAAPICDRCRKKIRDGEVLTGFYSANLWEPWRDGP